MGIQYVIKVNLISVNGMQTTKKRFGKGKVVQKAHTVHQIKFQMDQIFTCKKIKI